MVTAVSSYDIWGVAVPGWVGAISGWLSAAIAVWALLASNRSAKGVRAVARALGTTPSGVRPRTAGPDASWELALLPGRYALRNDAAATLTLTAVERLDEAAPTPLDIGALPRDVPSGGTVPFALSGDGPALLRSPVVPLRLTWTAAGVESSATLVLTR